MRRPKLYHGMALLLFCWQAQAKTNFDLDSIPWDATQESMKSFIDPLTQATCRIDKGTEGYYATLLIDHKNKDKERELDKELFKWVDGQLVWYKKQYYLGKHARESFNGKMTVTDSWEPGLKYFTAVLTKKYGPPSTKDAKGETLEWEPREETGQIYVHFSLSQDQPRGDLYGEGAILYFCSLDFIGEEHYQRLKAEAAQKKPGRKK